MVRRSRRPDGLLSVDLCIEVEVVEGVEGSLLRIGAHGIKSSSEVFVSKDVIHLLLELGIG